MITIWKQWNLAIKGQHRFCIQEHVSLESFCLLFGDSWGVPSSCSDVNLGAFIPYFWVKMSCYATTEWKRIKCVVYLLRKRRCRHEFENDRKCRKETKERRKVREGWKHSSGMECVPEILNVCVPRVYKSESGSVLPGRCFLQCNLSLWWNVWTTSDSTRAPDSLNIQL